MTSWAGLNVTNTIDLHVIPVGAESAGLNGLQSLQNHEMADTDNSINVKIIFAKGKSRYFINIM